MKKGEERKRKEMKGDERRRINERIMKQLQGKERRRNEKEGKGRAKKGEERRRKKMKKYGRSWQEFKEREGRR